MDFHQQDIRQFLQESIPLRFTQLNPSDFESFIGYLLEVDGFEIEHENQPDRFPGILLASKEGSVHVILPLLEPGIDELGVSQVERAVEAREFFSADQAWIITTSAFSPEARSMAEDEGIELWDWGVLNEALCQLFFEGQDHQTYFQKHPVMVSEPETETALRLKVKWEAAEGISSAWYNLGLTISNPTDRNIYLHLQLPALIDHKRQQVMADEWVTGEFVSGLIYSGASVRTNALFSAARLGERPPGGRIVLTCHERLDVPATYHLQAKLKGEACYLVTYCYSTQSREYIRMTMYRDQVLRKTIYGRFFIQIYYTISPRLIQIATMHKKSDAILRYLTSLVVNWFMSGKKGPV